MNRQEIASAINDFRKAFKDDLGTKVVYGQKTPNVSGGFYLDEQESTFQWKSQTSTGLALYGTVKSGVTEEIEQSGLDPNSQGIVTCIYEDILDLQANKLMDKTSISDDLLFVKANGIEEYYRIIDYATAFQLKDTYIFIKFGVVSVRKGEVEHAYEGE